MNFWIVEASRSIVKKWTVSYILHRYTFIYGANEFLLLNHIWWWRGNSFFFNNKTQEVGDVFFELIQLQLLSIWSIVFIRFDGSTMCIDLIQYDVIRSTHLKVLYNQILNTISLKKKKLYFFKNFFTLEFTAFLSYFFCGWNRIAILKNVQKAL